MDQENLEEQEGYNQQHEIEDENEDVLEITRMMKTIDGDAQIIKAGTEKQSDQKVQQPNGAEPSAKPLKKPTRPLSAYFLFIQEYKKKSGGKINLKEMGTIWNETSQDEKQIYVKMQAEEKKRYQQELEAYMAAEFANEEADVEEMDNELDMAFPLSRVKGILKHDPENKLMSKEVLLYLEKATELFGEYLAQRCYRSVLETKRKKLQTGDLYNVIKKDMYLNFLTCVIPEEGTGADGGEKDDVIEEKSAESSKQKERKSKDLRMEVEQEFGKQAARNNPNLNNSNSGKKDLKKSKPTPVAVAAAANNSKIDSFFKKTA